MIRLPPKMGPYHEASNYSRQLSHPLITEKLNSRYFELLSMKFLLPLSSSWLLDYPVSYSVVFVALYQQQVHK